MIDPTHALSITRQAEVLDISRASVYYRPRPTSAADLALMRRIDELHLAHPFAGARMLRHLVIERPNQVWAMDITYVPMQRGFVYLAAVLDWATRRVLSFRLSNTLTTDFFLEAVEAAIVRYGRPDIFNTDQGCQFTSAAFVGLLQHHGIRHQHGWQRLLARQCVRRAVVENGQVRRNLPACV